MDLAKQISCLPISSAIEFASVSPEKFKGLKERCGYDFDQLRDPDLWIDTHSWDKAAGAVVEISRFDGELFYEAGRRADKLELLGAIEFLPLFLSTPDLVIRNIHLFQHRLDRLFSPNVEYISEDDCRICFRLEKDLAPPQQYLSYLKGYLASILGLWGYEIRHEDALWQSDGDKWILRLGWAGEKPGYRRALEEFFVEPNFFQAVTEQLQKIHQRRTDRLTALLKLNRKLRHLAAESVGSQSPRSRAERAGEDIYKGLFTKLQDGVFRAALNGELVYANPASLRLLGFKSAKELQTKANTFDKLIPDARQRRRITKEYLRRGYIKDFELRLKRADGGTSELLVSVFPGRDPETGAEVIEGVLHDVTDKRRIQRALGQTHSFLEAIFESNPSGLQVIDGHGWTVRINPRLQKMLGFDYDSVIGEGKFNILSDPELTEIGLTDLVHQALSGQPSQSPSIVIQPGRSPLIKGLREPLVVSASAFPVQLSEEGVTHVVVSYRDITETHLIEQQLSQLQKLQSIHTLASGIAHDFNNILGAIVPSADLILSKAEPQSLISKKAAAIKTAAKRAATLIGKLMSFARESRGDKWPTDVNAGVKESIELISNALPKNVSLDYEPGEGLPQVLADPLQIQQVLINLIINASDASPHGGMITVCTELHKLTQRTTFGGNLIPLGEYVSLSVIDEGIGMPKEIVDRVFDPFFTTKDKGRGTGLGLSIVYGIVKNHNGFIHIDSQAGKGTRFDVYLPAVEGSNSETP